MESSTLVSATPSETRLIEYPADLSACNFLAFGEKQLLYLCSHNDGGTRRFVVVLGFFSGQKHDLIDKDLIEPIRQEMKSQIRDAVAISVPDDYIAAPILFL